MEAFVAWTDALRARGMGHVVDFVPNHMGIRTGENAWWVDVLENGPCSRFADYFDIDWAPPKEGLRGRVLLPILGAPYGEVLERGELRMTRDGGAFFIDYFERRLPVSSPTLAPILGRAAARLSLPRRIPGCKNSRASSTPSFIYRRATRPRHRCEKSAPARKR